MTLADAVLTMGSCYLAAGLVVAATINLAALSAGSWGEAVRGLPAIPTPLAHALVAVTLVVMLCRDAVLWPWALADVLP